MGDEDENTGRPQLALFRQLLKSCRSVSTRGADAAAAAADAEWNPQENGKPSSTEYIGIRSLHQKEGPEKKGKSWKFEKFNQKTREHGWKKTQKSKDVTENWEKIVRVFKK